MTRLRSKPKILIVDDDPNFRNVLSAACAGWGVVEVAANGREARRRLERDEFDIVITDVQMADGDGIELLDWIKTESDCPDIPVILVTGQSPIKPEEAVRRGAYTVLAKPFRLQEIFEVIAKARDIRGHE